MTIVFLILIVLACGLLGIIVLIQNPKGGGLSSSFGGFGNQIMGVKQTTDVLEKGTWLFAAIVGVLCVLSPAFIPKSAGSSSKNEELLKGVSAQPQKSAPAPANTATMPN